VIKEIKVTREILELKGFKVFKAKLELQEQLVPLENKETPVRPEPQATRASKEILEPKESKV
tara:strand:- start:369 stop:554 length:186 start_codon:yes stop_codon:yes gene_type:complete